MLIIKYKNGKTEGYNVGFFSIEGEKLNYREINHQIPDHKNLSSVEEISVDGVRVFKNKTNSRRNNAYFNIFNYFKFNNFNSRIRSFFNS